MSQWLMLKESYMFVSIGWTWTNNRNAPYDFYTPDNIAFMQFLRILLNPEARYQQKGVFTVQDVLIKIEKWN